MGELCSQGIRKAGEDERGYDKASLANLLWDYFRTSMDREIEAEFDKIFKFWHN